MANEFGSVDEATPACSDPAGDDPLAIAVYGPDDVRYEYFADELEDHADEIARYALRRPTRSVHPALEVVARPNPPGGGPQASAHVLES